MAVVIAHKTLQAIEDAINEDGGASYRQLLKKYLPEMDDAYRGKEDAFRSHFGYSQAAKSCGRDLWYSWRWSLKKNFEPRILRLFNRGHLEEAHFLALLEMIGATVYSVDKNGKQFSLSGDGGHSGSAVDCVATGIPGMETKDGVLVEMKTHGDKSFKLLHRQGVQKSKPVHFAQVQIYMAKLKLNWSLYMAVNKNDDNLYLEIIYKDRKVAKRFLTRTTNLIFMEEPPHKLSESPGWFECRFCDYKILCHGSEIPEINCRTCAHSTPEKNGTWTCEKIQAKLNKELQLAGCDQHIFNPAMINRAVMLDGDSEENWVEIELDEKVYKLGPNFMSSKKFKEVIENA